MNSKFFSDPQKNEIVKKSLERHLEKYGDMSYAFAVMNKRNSDNMIIISDLPDYFSQVYLENRFQNIDPVIINSLNRISPIIWDDSLMINSQWVIERIFESVTPYNIVSGHTFILHDQKNNLVVLSLYVNKYLESEKYDNITKNRNDIQGLLIDTHEMLLHLYREENEIPSVQGNAISLSARENEILYWSSTGKTYPEIARMLNITVSTVKFHMGKIVKKLGVNNAKHAISLAIELNIISHPSGR